MFQPVIDTIQGVLSDGTLQAVIIVLMVAVAVIVGIMMIFTKDEQKVKSYKEWLIRALVGGFIALGAESIVSSVVDKFAWSAMISAPNLMSFIT